MFKRHLFLLLALLMTSLQVNAQYTETINSNRPGVSQGAFAVGRNVLQLETGLRFGQDRHSLLDYRTNLAGLDYSLRYGAFMEQLEFQLTGSYLYSNQTQTIGGIDQERNFSNFQSNFIGAKYLVYDPYRARQFDKPNIRSWHANYAFKWETLIPAISVFAGANVLFGDNPYLAPETGNITPQIGVSTQNNWQQWVFVMNLIADEFTEETPTFSGVFTLTRTLNKEFSVFAEYQVIKSDFYSDNIARLGGAYLISDDFQLDAYGLTNFKNTPQRWQVGVGLSYRLDMHNVDEILRPKKKKKAQKDKKKERTEKLDNSGDSENKSL